MALNLMLVVARSAARAPGLKVRDAPVNAPIPGDVVMLVARTGPDRLRQSLLVSVVY